MNNQIQIFVCRDKLKTTSFADFSLKKYTVIHGAKIIPTEFVVSLSDREVQHLYKNIQRFKQV